MSKWSKLFESLYYNDSFVVQYDNYRRAAITWAKRHNIYATSLKLDNGGYKITKREGAPPNRKRGHPVWHAAYHPEEMTS